MTAMRIMPGAAARRFPPPARPRTCPTAPSRRATRNADLERPPFLRHPSVGVEMIEVGLAHHVAVLAVVAKNDGLAGRGVWDCGVGAPMPTFVISHLIDTFHLGKRRPHARSTVSAMIGADHDGFAQSAESAPMSHRPRQLCDDADSFESGSQSTFSAKRSRMQASICSRSDLVRQNIAKCACRLSMTRNSLFGMSFCSASQSAGGKNMSREKGTT